MNVMYPVVVLAVILMGASVVGQMTEQLKTSFQKNGLLATAKGVAVHVDPSKALCGLQTIEFGSRCLEFVTAATELHLSEHDRHSLWKGIAEEQRQACADFNNRVVGRLHQIKEAHKAMMAMLNGGTVLEYYAKTGDAAASVRGTTISYDAHDINKRMAPLVGLGLGLVIVPTVALTTYNYVNAMRKHKQFQQQMKMVEERTAILEEQTASMLNWMGQQTDRMDNLLQLHKNLTVEVTLLRYRQWIDNSIATELFEPLMLGLERLAQDNTISPSVVEVQALLDLIQANSHDDSFASYMDDRRQASIYTFGYGFPVQFRQSSMIALICVNAVSPSDVYMEVLVTHQGKFGEVNGDEVYSRARLSPSYFYPVGAKSVIDQVVPIDECSRRNGVALCKMSSLRSDVDSLSCALPPHKSQEHNTCEWEIEHVLPRFFRHIQNGEQHMVATNLPKYKVNLRVTKGGKEFRRKIKDVALPGRPTIFSLNLKDNEEAVFEVDYLKWATVRGSGAAKAHPEHVVPSTKINITGLSADQLRGLERDGQIMAQMMSTLNQTHMKAVHVHSKSADDTATGMELPFVMSVAALCIVGVAVAMIVIYCCCMKDSGESQSKASSSVNNTITINNGPNPPPHNPTAPSEPPPMYSNNTSMYPNMTTTNVRPVYK